MSNTGSDNVFTTLAYKWNIGSYSKPFHIIPIGDVHSDSPGHCRPTLNESLAHIRALHDAGEEYRVFGMGDYIDFCSDSERAKLARPGKGGLHESTNATHDKTADRAMQEFCDLFAFTKGKWIGVIQGNHYWKFLTGDAQEKGKTTDMVIAEQMGCKWLGWATYAILQLKYGTSQASLDIFASHGKGGGQLLGSPYNNVSKMRNIFPSADIYMMGHDHSKGVLPDTTLDAHVDSSKGVVVVKHKTQLFCRTGSFVTAYDDGEPNYVVRSLWSPSSIGHVEILGKTTRTRKCAGAKSMTRVDIKGIA